MSPNQALAYHAPIQCQIDAIGRDFPQLEVTDLPFRSYRCEPEQSHRMGARASIRLSTSG